MPVGFLPPWVKTSHPSSFFFASIATTMHWDPNFFELCITTFESSTAAVLIDTLSAPQLSNLLISSIFHYGKYSVKEAKDYLDSKGIPVGIWYA